MHTCQGYYNNYWRTRKCYDCAPFTVSIIEINNTQVGDNYWKTSRNLWKHCADEPTLNNDGAFTNFLGKSFPFKSNTKLTGKIP